MQLFNHYVNTIIMAFGANWFKIDFVDVDPENFKCKSNEFFLAINLKKKKELF